MHHYDLASFGHTIISHGTTLMAWIAFDPPTDLERALDHTPRGWRTQRPFHRQFSQRPG